LIKFTGKGRIGSTTSTNTVAFFLNHLMHDVKHYRRKFIVLTSAAADLKNGQSVKGFGVQVSAQPPAKRTAGQIEKN
jgi:hypothetical protein